MNIVVTGVAWTGRESIGSALAVATGRRFIPGSHLHPRANRAKLARREVLTPTDCAAWFDAIGFKLALRGRQTVVACPALRRCQRDRIRFAALGDVTFVHLHGPREIIEARMIASGESPGEGRRQLDHQFSVLEPPMPDEDAISIDLGLPRQQIVDDILAGLALQVPPEAQVPHPGEPADRLQVADGA